MGQITIRGIAPEVEKEIRRISKDTGKSINLVIQEIIYQHAGFSKKRKRAPSESLRQLAGGWSDKEAGDFQTAIKSCEQVDEEFWK
jgi:hypothetical protein